MATFTLNPPSGSFPAAQTPQLTLGSDVKRYGYTVNQPAPSVSKYIAYDTLTPPNPFIAVTEDGRGRVVYDGGFPKLYDYLNRYQPGQEGQFQYLTPGAKYIHNAVKWVRNPAKFLNGNNKILILGDNTQNDAFSVKTVGVNADGQNVGFGFHQTLVNIMAIAGMVPTFKDLSDYPDTVNQLNPTLAELEQYACVFLLGAAPRSPENPRITNNAVNDFVTYRENGNGIILVTDDGVNIADASSVPDALGYFRTCNHIAIRFGAYFTGDYDRQSVSLQYIRDNYGDHPLYENMSNDESIFAGASESRVVVTPAQLFDRPANGVAQADLTVSLNGLNYVNLIAEMTDGSIQTARYVYNIQGDEFVFVRVTDPKSAAVATNPTTMTVDEMGKSIFDCNLDGSTLGTIWGIITHNGKRIGELQYASGVSGFNIYQGANNLVLKNGDTISFSVISPFSYSKDMVVNRSELPDGMISLTNWLSQVNKVYGGSASSGTLIKAHSSLAGKLPSTLLSFPASIASALRIFQQIKEGSFDTTPIEAKVVDTQAQADALVAGGTLQIGDIVAVLSNQSVYGYLSGRFQLLPGLTPAESYGFPRRLKNSLTGKYYRITAGGSLVASDSTWS